MYRVRVSVWGRGLEWGGFHGGRRVVGVDRETMAPQQGDKRREDLVVP